MKKTNEKVNPCGLPLRPHNRSVYIIDWVADRLTGNLHRMGETHPTQPHKEDRTAKPVNTGWSIMTTKSHAGSYVQLESFFARYLLSLCVGFGDQEWRHNMVKNVSHLVPLITPISIRSFHLFNSISFHLYPCANKRTTPGIYTRIPHNLYNIAVALLLALMKMN